jgi:hypothetical protein
VRGRRLFEQSCRLVLPPGLLVEFSGNDVVEGVPGVVLGKGARLGDAGREPPGLRFDADQISPEWTAPWITREGLIQDGVNLGIILCRIE